MNRRDFVKFLGQSTIATGVAAVAGLPEAIPDSAISGDKSSQPHTDEAVLESCDSHQVSRLRIRTRPIPDSEVVLDSCNNFYLTINVSDGATTSLGSLIEQFEQLKLLA